MRPNSKYFQERPTTKSDVKMNHAIKAPTVFVINEHGEKLGVLSFKDAMAKALESNLDLVEVSNSTPPVCKIMDHGKYVYEQAKKKKDAHKATKHEDKEIRLRPSTGQHDLEIKARKAKEFLEDGRKVNIHFKLVGREKNNTQVLHEVVNKFYSMLQDVGKLEQKGGKYVIIPVT